MKKNILVLFLVVITFMLNIGVVKADVCDSNDIARLTELSKRISFDYKFIGDTDDDEVTSLQDYRVSFNNLGSDFYIKVGKKIYTKDKSTIVQSGEVTFQIYSSTCNVKLRNEVLELKKFNENSVLDVCKGLKDKVELCDKWYQGDVSEEEVERLLTDYHDSEVSNVESNFLDSIVGFVLSYWFFIIPFIIGIIFIIVSIRIRKNRLD